MVSLVRSLVVTGTLALGIGLLALLLALRVAPPLPWWPILALDSLTLYAFIPFLLVAAVALITRSRALAVLSLSALLLFLVTLGGPILSVAMIAAGFRGPRAATADQRQTPIRLLTLNLHAPNDDATPFAVLVREIDPDVVVFQEVTTAFARNFDRLLDKEYPFSATAGLEANHFGSGTWSRLPLGEREAIRFGLGTHTMHRVQLLTGSEPGHAPVWLYNVHLANPTGDNREDGELAMLRRWDTVRRDAERDALAESTAGLGVPFILAGDFNTSSSSYAYRQFPSSWRDAHAQAGRGLGFTYPSPAHEDRGSLLRLIAPLARIDYVLTSPSIRSIGAATRSLPVTDHFAIVADLILDRR